MPFNLGASRRRFLRDACCGFGGLALSTLFDNVRQTAARGQTLVAKSPPSQASATSVIFLFMAGGPSHVDTFDPKPVLNQLDGKPRPVEFGDAKYQFARIASYDLAFKMQTEAPQVFDLSGETRETLDLYGIDRPATDDYGRRCLLARRLVEKGVRFITVVSGGGAASTLQWDAHADVEEDHLRMAGKTDQPIAALLTDLKRRGLLASTLVMWGGEFGRSPEAESGKGRDHHNLGFTTWMAGGGVRGGQVVGATDAIGLRAVEKPHHFRDLHTTLLHLLGFDQNDLTFPHLGRDERLTLIEGEVIHEIV